MNAIFSSPFFWGLVVGLVLGGTFLVLALISHARTKGELKRYQKHLSDKLQIEAEQFSALKKEKEEVKEENERLRLKIGAGGSGESTQSLERELEIFARAEKTLMINAPGFASAWETAKEQAHGEIQEEERGKSLPKRIFRKFFGADGNKRGAHQEEVELLETKSSDKSAS